MLVDNKTIQIESKHTFSVFVRFWGEICWLGKKTVRKLWVFFYRVVCDVTWFRTKPRPRIFFLVNYLFLNLSWGFKIECSKNLKTPLFAQDIGQVYDW